MPDLQTLLNRVNEASKKYGLSININKTKMMVINKGGVENVHLELMGEHIERVSYFKYLGAWINEDMNPDEGIKVRMVQGTNDKRPEHISEIENLEVLCLVEAALQLKNLNSDNGDHE
ncbi:hypothetical protein PGB90_006074 [Kerria lacca]